MVNTHTRTRRIGIASLTVALLLLTCAPRSDALFHLALIDEVMTSYNGDPEVQFVEIRMLAVIQKFTANTVLGAFDASGNFLGEVLVVPGNVARDGVGVRWLMGTAAFEGVSGVMPDFVMPPSLPLDGGMVCWGAPGASAPNPASWDHSNPANYVDCLAYGNYAGPTNSRIGMSTPLLPEGHSLVRVGNSHNNLTDFACDDPATPTNNTGTMAMLAASTSCFMQGDVNHDAQVDTNDLTALVAAIFSDAPPPEADVNEDEGIGAADLVALVRIVSPS